MPEEPATSEPPAEPPKEPPKPLEPAAVIEQMKAAGVEDPSAVLELVKKLRPYERGDKLPEAVAKELEDLRAKVKDAENAKLSDLEKAQSRIAELEAAKADAERRTAELALRGSVQEAAAKAGASNPGAVWRLLDLAEVEYDASGEPKNVEKLVEKAKGQFPEFFPSSRAGSFDGGVRGSSAPGQQSMNDLLRKAAGR